MFKTILIALAIALTGVTGTLAAQQTEAQTQTICDAEGEGKVAIEFLDGYHCVFPDEGWAETPIEERVYDPNEVECDGIHASEGCEGSN